MASLHPECSANACQFGYSLTPGSDSLEHYAYCSILRDFFGAFQMPHPWQGGIGNFLLIEGSASEETITKQGKLI